MRKILVFTLAVLAFLPAAAVTRAEFQQAFEAFKAYPEDRPLREEVVKAAASLSPRPAIPEDANRPFIKAITFQKAAKDKAGYDLAIKAYREALVLAPWWPEANYNLSVALEAAGRYGEAADALKIYLLTKPSAADAAEAKNRLYALEARSELAQVESKNTDAEKSAAARELMQKSSGIWRDPQFYEGQKVLNRCEHTNARIEGDWLVFTVAGDPGSGCPPASDGLEFMRLKPTGDRTFEGEFGKRIGGGTLTATLSLDEQKIEYQGVIEKPTRREVNNFVAREGTYPLR
jgi:tetratricopeptide (TPR) repeat protein